MFFTICIIAFLYFVFKAINQQTMMNWLSKSRHGDQLKKEYRLPNKSRLLVTITNIRNEIVELNYTIITPNQNKPQTMNIKPTFAIGIPTLNRYDLLKPTLEKYVLDFPNTEIYVLDNGNQGIHKEYFGNNVTVIVADQNCGVSKSWNLLSREIFIKCDYAMLLNDDIYLGRTEEQITRLITDCQHQDFIVGTGTWCAFLLKKETFETVGGFDENIFPAYFEDNDYHYRMKLAGKSYFQTEILNPEIYRNSQTIAKDYTINNRFNDNKNYYINKWGGEPGKETFATPYNQ